MVGKFATFGFLGNIMSEHKLGLHWEYKGVDFSYDSLNRNHLLSFDNGCQIRASSALAYLGDDSAIDPEEMLVAAISS